MMGLFQRSIDIILENQSATGAYPACPTFPTYQYCWYRDGSFIAYAMDLAGEHGSARRFHEWAAKTVLRNQDIVARVVARQEWDTALSPQDILHTRYDLDGSPGLGAWPNFQLDGFGTWLWSLGEHQRQTGESLSTDMHSAASLVAQYVAHLWQVPCFDCWEEFPEKIHTYTLAALYAGLIAAGKLKAGDFEIIIRNIRAYMLDKCKKFGSFVKYAGTTSVDASLLGLAVPYGIVAVDDSTMRATVEKIETELRNGGGVHRYAKDTYYGGGEWVLLTAWLGWYYKLAGESDKALEALVWVESQADGNSHLPEQVPVNLNDTSYYEPWRQRWGDIASPLLWSHAKHVILRSVI